MRCLLLISLLLFGTLSQAQSLSDSSRTGYIRFLVDVDNGYFEIVVDDTLYLKQYKCELPAGKHRAKIWSPGYLINLVDFEVKAGQTVDKYVPMAISNGRQAFEREYKAYRMEFHKAFTVPLSISLGLGLTSGAFMTTAYISKNKVYDDLNLYDYASTYDEAVTIRENIAINNRKYNTRRVMFYTTLGLTAAAIGTTIFTFKRFKKKFKEPQLVDPSPFEDKFSMGISPFGCTIKWRFG